MREQTANRGTASLSRRRLIASAAVVLLNSSLLLLLPTIRTTASFVTTPTPSCCMRPRRRKIQHQSLHGHGHGYGTSTTLLYRTSSQQGSEKHMRTIDGNSENDDDDRKAESPCSNASSSLFSRRRTLAALATTATTVLLPPPPLISTSQQAASAATTTDSLEEILAGEGRWDPRNNNGSGKNGSAPLQQQQQAVESYYYTASFVSYATRFLVKYDKGVQTWWRGLEESLQLLPNDKQTAKLGQNFGRFAKSLQLGFENTSSTDLYDRFVTLYGQSDDADARRQIALLFALLPKEKQPVSRLEEYSSQATNKNEKPFASKRLPLSKRVPEDSTTTTLFGENLTRLLPSVFDISKSGGDSTFFSIEPSLTLYEVGIGEEFGQVAVATAFGPLASSPLVRERPVYSPQIYSLFGLAGATGCALTHTVVIPLDVVKTRAQTDPTTNNMSDDDDDSYRKSITMIDAARNIVDREGISGLLLGAQATIAGYFWYGLSVYPSYAFCKRWLSQSNIIYNMDYVVAHGNEIALVAGALAAVAASLGLTPLEAARIRVVADPDEYRPLGLTGTLGVIASEDPTLGWTNLYAGLPSLLTRQVIFGSVKFLAFERACDLIFATLPFLRDATWTSLLVSLVAGGFSGILSSVVSQPADSVLTYVAKDNTGSLGLLVGAQQMVAEDGPGSLFRGLGSRCVWAGSIIAGQFLLYDVFRTLFGVNTEDLSQVYQVIVPGGG